MPIVKVAYVNEICFPMSQSRADWDTPKSSIPVPRWSRPGFLDRITGQKKPTNFVFDKLGGLSCPIALRLHRIQTRSKDGAALVPAINLKWDDGYWIDLGSDYEAACRRLTPSDAERMMQENEDLAASIEILLDMTTNYELKKASLRQKLETLEHRIRAFPGVEDDIDQY